MEFVIISGLSGAGKSRAASIMEDMGFFCVDNLPAPLIPKFAELGMGGNGEYDRVVLVTDIRGGTRFDSLFQALDGLRAMQCAYSILFMEADLVFDVRFLPNPYYVAELRPRTGLDDGVRDYALSAPQSREFLLRLTDFVTYLLPRYVEEGKTSLTIAVGCTGGRHRSVAVAHALAEAVRQEGYPVGEVHRDLGRI